jgi:hypothetical protein
VQIVCGRERAVPTISSVAPAQRPALRVAFAPLLTDEDEDDVGSVASVLTRLLFSAAAAVASEGPESDAEGSLGLPSGGQTAAHGSIEVVTLRHALPVGGWGAAAASAMQWANLDAPALRVRPSSNADVRRDHELNVMFSTYW